MIKFGVQDDAGTSFLTLKVVTMTPTLTQVFTAHDIMLTPNDSAQLLFGAWSGSGPMTFVTAGSHPSTQLLDSDTDASTASTPAQNNR